MNATAITSAPARKTHHFIIEHLSQVLTEMEQQHDAVAPHAGVEGLQPLRTTFLQTWEFLEANEWSQAYESLVYLLEELPFHLTGRSAVALLEVGLLLQFKTEHETDRDFDFRAKD